MKLIDLVSMTPIDQSNGAVRDAGMVKGVDSLIQLITEIEEEDYNEDEDEYYDEYGYEED